MSIKLMQSRPSEATIINSFISNSQSTHTTAVTNSVGMAVLHLLKLYFKEEQTPAIIEKKYLRCIEEMKRFADKEDRRAALDFLITKASEPLNTWDNVFLFLPDQTGKYVSITHVLSLKLVIPLVWTALKDNDKFTHNYAGNAAEQFSQARGDYNNRVHDLFKILTAVNNDQLCHTGLRHEYVFILNKTYSGVDIIEDALSTIAATLKDHTNSLFWQHYQTAPTQARKKELTTALYGWMRDYNPASLLQLVDPQHTAQQNLAALFIRHGSDPETINVTKLIDDCLPTLNFNYDPQQYPVINVIENIFNSQSETIDAALTKIKAWIVEHVTLEDSVAAATLQGIYILFKTLTMLDKRMELLLAATGHMHENFHTIKKYCEDYFARVSAADLASEFPEIEQVYLQHAQQLQISIVNCKSNKMTDFIENFFARWIIAVNEHNLPAKQYLYRFLLDEDFHQKIIYTDAEIDAFWHQEDASNFKDITVYQINRVFLHAYLITRTQWTDTFRDLLTRVFDYVNKDLRQQNHLHHLHLIESSYSSGMLSSLKQIIEDQRDEDEFIAYEDIYLPHHIKNKAQWIKMAESLSDEKLLEIYEPQAVKINAIIIRSSSDYTEFNLSSILPAIPEKYRYTFTQHATVKILIGQITRNGLTDDADRERLRSTIKAINRLLPMETKIKVWVNIFNAFDPIILINFYNHLHTCDLWKDLLKVLPTTDLNEFLSYFPEYTSGEDWTDGEWLVLPSAQLMAFFKKIKANQKKTFLLVNLYDKFAPRVMAKLDAEHKIELLKCISMDMQADKIKVMMLDNNFYYNLRISFGDDVVDLLTHLSMLPAGVDLKSMHPTDYLLELFFILPVEKRFPYLLLLGDNFLSRANLQVLNQIADNLPENYFGCYASSMSGKAIITTICQKPSTDVDKIKILKAMGKYNIPNYKFILETLDWRTQSHTILRLLPAEESFIYFMEKGYEKTFLNDCLDKKIDLDTLLRSFTERQLKQFFNMMQDKITFLMARKILDLDTLTSNPAIKAIVDEERVNFVSVFRRIYTALWEGQTSFFKSENWIEKEFPQTITTKQAMELILRHAAQPGSRSEKALSLMKKHIHHNVANESLLNDIYLHAFSKSGLLKYTKTYSAIGKSEYFFKTASLRHKSKFDMLRNFEGRPTKRSEKIVYAMRN